MADYIEIGHIQRECTKACNEGNVDLLRQRLKEKTFIRTHPNVSFTAAIKNGHINVVKFLVEEAKCEFRNYIGHLDTCLMYKQDDIAIYLIEQGLVLDQEVMDTISPITRYASRGNVELMDLMVRHGAVMTEDVLRVAIQSDSIDVANYLAHQGVRMMDPTDTLFYYMERSDCKEATVQYLIDQGADVNNTEVINNAIDRGTLNHIKTLVAKGAQPTSIWLLNAVLNGRYTVCQFLLACGVEVNERYLFGCTKKNNPDLTKLIASQLDDISSVVALHPDLFYDPVTTGYWRTEFETSEELCQHREFMLSQFASVVGSENSALVATVCNAYA